MEESRKQFEEWYMTTFLVDKYWVEDMRREPDTYTLGEGILIYWECWKASRAAIEIELPDKVMVEDEFDNGHNCAIDYCAYAIRAAGLTVKGDR